MELTMLGTAAGRPIEGRNVTAAALAMPAQRGTYWLFDCGEGTQHQLLRAGIRLGKLERVFVTHLHGDHIFGLPGLLGSRSSMGCEEPLAVYGPRGIRHWLGTTFDVTGTHLHYELEIHEIEDDGGVVYEDEQFTVTAEPLSHRIACYGYRIAERPRPGRLDAAKLAALGVPPGPLYARLKAGEDAELPDGRVIRAAEVTGPPIPGRVIAILGDTTPCEAAVRLAEGADLVVHEATFEAGLADKAAEYGHSTTAEAARTARDAGAARLLLTHFSGRYRDEDLSRLEAEAREIFPSSAAARDFLTVHLPHKRRS
jgi:ribonuclease Z